MNCCIAIPAYEPKEEMLSYLHALAAAHTGPILVVDDGSGPAYQDIFSAAAQIENCLILHHETNRGKGAAIKTALAYYEEHLLAEYAGLITADCDGQHAVPDVLKTARALKEYPGTLVLGSREFGKDTPQRSAMGNKVTSVAMRLLYDIRLKDTQTGLRGIPNNMVAAMRTLKGERYDYELNMLIYANQKCIPFTLVSIKTIYFENNAGSHYKTVPDSLRLVRQMFRGVIQYSFASAISGVIDVIIYALMVKLLLVAFPAAERLFLAAFFARVASSSVNYAFNRKLPYVQNNEVLPTLIKYYALWCCQLAVSFGAVWALYTFAGFDELIAKLIIDALLGILSYQIQMRWVFHKSANAGAPAVIHVAAEEEVLP